MKCIAVIPARLHSKRFPKKILFPIDEKPMVVHVYENAKTSELIDDVIIAVDDAETVNELKKWKQYMSSSCPYSFSYTNLFNSFSHGYEHYIHNSYSTYYQ